MRPRLLAILAVIITLGLSRYSLQQEQRDVPANAYRGLVPGVATFDDVLAKLGKPNVTTTSNRDLRYRDANRPQLSDRLFFSRDKLALVTSASTDERYATRKQILSSLGEPEARIVHQTQEYLDYSEQGLRFICAAEGRVTGVIYFAPTRRRVPAGYPNTHVNLRRDIAATQATKPPGDFRVGTAEISIAPQTFEKLIPTKEGAGKLHLAEDLQARVAIFEHGKTKVVLIGVDVFGLGPWDIDRLRESLKKRGFENVIVAMSHTHANVDTIGFYGYYPRDYAQFVIERAATCVLSAATRMQPVKSLRNGSVEMPLAGGRVVDLIRNGRDPGVIDPTVSLLQAVGKNGKPIVNVVNLACHPEVIRLKETAGLSPDFVGTLCNEVTRRLGGQTVFLNGALGGMITPDTPMRDQKAAEEMGRRLADFVEAAARSANPSSSYRLSFLRRPVQYPITSPNILQFLQNPPQPYQLNEQRVESEMNLLWIGDAQFISVPGELLPDIALEIQAAMSGRLRCMIGLANGELGYLVPSFDFRADHYEEQTGPGAAGGEITRAVGLELARQRPEPTAD